jgi:hypothetical protein
MEASSVHPPGERDALLKKDLSLEVALEGYWLTTLWLRNFLMEMALPTKPSTHPYATTMP